MTDYKEKIEETKEKVKENIEHTKEIIVEYEKGTNFKIICICILCCLLTFAAGYFIGIRNAGSDIHDNGNGIEPIRNELGTAISNQHEITNGLESAVTGSNRIEERSDRIEKAAGAAEKSVGEAGRLIDECQQIVGRIRNRGKKGTPAN